MVSRRTAIIGGGAGALALGALGYRAWDRGVFQGASGPAYDAWDEWQGTEADGPKRPLRAAILAASPHNTQPWLFEAKGDSITVYADRSRHLGTFDPFRREMHIGLGCAIENLRIASAVTGLNAYVTPTAGRLEPSPGASAVPVAEIAFLPARRTGQSLFPAIPKRHTHRGPYQPDREINAARFAALVSGPNTRMAFVTDAAARKELGTLITGATEQIIADPEMSADSFRWIRTGRRDVEAHGDGVTIDTAGIDPMTVILGKLAPDQNAASTDKVWIDTTRDTHTATAAVYGIIMVRDRLDMAAALATGRAWQSLHLAFASEGLAAQPLNQPMEMIDRNAMLGRNDTYRNALGKLAKAEAGWEPMFVFRMGYAEQPSLPSPRRRLEDMMKA